MLDETTNTEQSRVAADCPNERLVRRDYYDYVALIEGGIGPDVWDKELTCAADNILDAARYFHGKAEEIGGAVISIEQYD